MSLCNCVSVRGPETETADARSWVSVKGHTGCVARQNVPLTWDRRPRLRPGLTSSLPDTNAAGNPAEIDADGSRVKRRQRDSVAAPGRSADDAIAVGRQWPRAKDVSTRVAGTTRPDASANPRAPSGATATRSSANGWTIVIILGLPELMLISTPLPSLKPMKLVQSPIASEA